MLLYLQSLFFAYYSDFNCALFIISKPKTAEEYLDYWISDELLAKVTLFLILQFCLE